jgi:hypothetical protein
MKLAQQRPEYYNVEELGIPINDLDCMGTIGTFSATLIWLGLPRQGIFLRRQEIEDYVALFRYIGYLTGTPTDYFSTPEKARAVMESLLMNEIAPSQTSANLAGNIIRCLEGHAPSYASKEFLEANSRWLNGNELCDALKLGRPGLWYWALTAAQCGFFMLSCYISRSFEFLDKRKIAASKRLLWLMIVEGKYGLKEESSFDFKYLPDLGKMTQAEAAEKSGITEPGVERRNLKALVLGSAFLGFSVYLGTKLVAVGARTLVSFV